MSLFTATTVEKVKSLIDLGYNVNSRDVLDLSVLHRACEKGNLDIVKVLCEAGANINHNCWDFYPIDKAAKAGYLHIVKYFIENYPVKLDYILYNASVAGNIDVLDYLLTLNLNLNNSYHNPLIIACQNGHIDVVDKLLYAGVDTNIVDINGRIAIVVATNNNRLDIVKRLVMFGVDYHTYGGKSLVISCYYSYNDISDFLIELGCNVNYCFNDMTALIHACYNNNLKIVKLLLEHGADPNFETNDGKKAIDYCVSDELKDLFTKN